MSIGDVILIIIVVLLLVLAVSIVYMIIDDREKDRIAKMNEHIKQYLDEHGDKDDTIVD